MLRTICLVLAVVPITIAQFSVTKANCTDSRLNWVFNSMGQSPCYVASILTYPCGNAFGILPLPSGSVYQVEKGQNNACTCNSVFYSLTSACSACRDGGWNTWSSFATNCSSTYYMEYPESIPSNTTVPGWAYLNVTASNDTFDVAVASSTVGSNSTAPATSASSSVLISKPSVTSTSASISSSTTSTSSSHLSKSKIAGIVVGSVLGGVAFISCACRGSRSTYVTTGHTITTGHITTGYITTVGA